MATSKGLFGKKDKKLDGPVMAKAEAKTVKSSKKPDAKDYRSSCPPCEECSRIVVGKKGSPCQMGLARGENPGCKGFWPRNGA